MSELTDFYLKGESEMAIRVAVDKAASGTWLPKSILKTIHKMPRHPDGSQKVKVDLPRWKARELGLD